MKSILTSLSLLLFLGIFWSNAQTSEDNPKHENHYAALKPIETNLYTLTFSDMHAQQEFSLVKVSITNKTNDFLFWDISKCVFAFEGGEKRSPEPKTIIIEPKGSKKKTIKVAGGYNFHVDQYDLTITGFSILPVEKGIINVDDFKLPPATNSFQAGDFACDLKKHKQETKETVSSFSCKYSGTGMGLLRISAPSVKADPDLEYATVNKSSSIKLVKPGKVVKFETIFQIPGKILDMQFANMTIAWNKTFASAMPEPQKASHQMKLVKDPGLTSGHN